MHRIHPYFFALAIFCFGAFMPVAFGQQPNAGQTFTLAKIEFTGLERLKLEDAVAASGLSVGQAVDVAALDAAGDRLNQSGLFKKLSYRLRTQKDQATVTFTVEEATVRLPVVFDNFIWFTDDELIAAVHREVPGFDGTAPESGDVVEGIKRALIGLLRKKQVAGSVDYAPSSGANGRVDSMRFTYSGEAVNVCSINFPGAAEIEESVLQKQARLVMGKEYSRAYTLGVARESLLPLYRKRGMLKAAFTNVQGRPASTEQCHDGGVAVTVSVEEGFIYHLSALEWNGNAVLEGPELSHAFDMHPGDLADGIKLDTAFDAVRLAYAKRGYIEVKLEPALEFDDEKKTVGYRTAVVEGAQFLMGNLTLTGLPEEELAKLKSRWKLQPGDVYDGTFLDEFNKTILIRDTELQEMTRRLGLTRTILSVRPDRAKRTVAVTITFARPE